MSTACQRPALALDHCLTAIIPYRALVLLALVPVLLVGCGQEGAGQGASEPPAVGVIEVSEQKVNPYFEFVGKTRAAETVSLRARVTGFLEERAFDEGGEVEAGEVLFRIEPEQYQATLAQAEASLGAAEASLKRAQVDLARYEELAKAKNVSQQKVDEAQAEVLVQEASVDTAKADIDKAKLNVDYTEIKAPIAGRIDIAAYTVGNLIGPDSGVLATINQMDPIKVAFSIAETWYLEIMKESQAEQRAQGGGGGEPTHVPRIKLSDGSIYGQDGHFDFIDNKVDEKTGTVLVRAVFPNPDKLLLPGQFVNVVIERKEAVESVVIPQAAVLTDQGGSYVLLVDDEDKVESRRIETGQRFGPSLAVKKGLKAGDRIVMYGIQKVRPGVKVKPELTEAPGAELTAETRSMAGGGGAEAAEIAEGGQSAVESAADTADAPNE